MSKILAVHFLQADMRPKIGRGSPWKVGETRSVKGELLLCRHGFHYSPTWKAALIGGYLYGPMACVVEVEDEGPHDESKGCSRTRTLVEAFNVEREQRLFAADEASRCLKLWEKRSGKVADSHSWAVIQAMRAFANGEITGEDLRSARAAAADSAYFAYLAAAYLAAADLAAADSAYFAYLAAADSASARRFAAVMGNATGYWDVKE